MSARDEILGKVRAALATRPPGEVEVPRGYRSAPAPATGEALIDLFVERVEDYRATVRRCRGDELAAAIEEAVAGRRAIVPPELPWAVAGRSPTPDSRPLSSTTSTSWSPARPWASR